MTRILWAMLLPPALGLASIQSVAEVCSMKCRFSSGSIQCDKEKPLCSCSVVETFEGTCGGSHGGRISLDTTASQLNEFERVIENLKTDHELTLVVDGMRNILQAAKKRDVPEYISSTDKVKDAVKKLSTHGKEKLQEQMVAPRYSAECVSAHTDLVGGRCLDSLCNIACATTPEINRLPNRRPSLDLANLTVKFFRNKPQPTAAECRRLFAFALRMPSGWDRVATEKNALTILSRSDPELAMQLFPKVEPPLPIDRLGFPEDVRAYAAIEIFENYWKAVGTKGLGNIRNASRHIGDTGEYPYRAMSSVMNELIELPREDRLALANEILNEAIGYYQRGSQFLNRDEEFFALLERARDFVPPNDYLPGIRLLVRNLLINRDSNAHFIAEIGMSQGFVRFTNMNLALLFRAFPLLAEADSQWADLLVNQYPELRNARMKIVYVAAGIVYGDAAPLQLARLQKELLQ
jgi:hypothetical protein